MGDERNFRSSYYEKVGFRSVEEKKSLEILLKERPLDKGKLKQFCLRFTVPALYRNFLWKVLLGVIPVYSESQELVMSQRREEFEDLQRALRVMKTVDDSTKLHHVLLTMWMLRAGRVALDTNLQMENPLLRSMSQLAETLSHIIDADHDTDKVGTFWILGGFLDQVQKFQGEMGRLQECTCNLLEREDPELYKYLVKIDALQNLPLDTWFCSCFAGTITDGSIPKVWDKIAGGAYKVLVFVAVVTLTTSRRVLLRCKSLDCVLDCLNNIPEETSEVIVNKAIESWQQSGSTLVSVTQNTISVI